MAVSSPGVYQSKFKNRNGCDSIINTTIRLSSTDCYQFNPSMAFTPNGDGINDTWNFLNWNCVKQVQLNIYNRWGGVVFQSSNYQNNWKGEYNGEPLPDGTYYYAARILYVNNVQKTKRGDVTILR